MITKDQANSIADQLLDQQRAETLSAKNAAAQRVPFSYRCPELQQLEPWQRAEVVREARQRLRDHKVTIACMIAWGVAFGAFWYLFVPVATRISFHFCGVVMLFFPPVVWRVSLVRLHVRYLARLREFSSSASD